MDGFLLLRRDIMGKTNLDQIQLDKEPAVTQADAPIVSATPTQAEVQAIADLANALKTKLNSICKG